MRLLYILILIEDKRRIELPRVITQIISNYPYFTNSRLSQIVVVLILAQIYLYIHTYNFYKKGKN